MKLERLSKFLKSDYIETVILAIILLVGIFAFWFGLRFALQTEFPMLAVASGSMEPVFYRGDLIMVQGGLNFTELNAASKDAQPPGEIIVYYDPRYEKEPIYLPIAGKENHLIVHRAVKKYQVENGTWYFYTRGDANPGSSYDPWTMPNGLRQDYIVGKVIGKVPWIGYIPLFMHENRILAALIIVLLLVVLITVDFIFPQKKDKKTTGQEEKPSNVTISKDRVMKMRGRPKP